MVRHKDLQTSFASGQLSEEIDAREDTEQYNNGARSLLNRRCLIGGGTCRRPGSWFQFELTQSGRSEAWVVDQTTNYIAVFSAGRVDFYSRNITTGFLTAAGSLTGAPWTGTIYLEMDFTQSGNVAFLTHPTMATQVITRTGASSWVRSAFTFFTNGPRVQQVYYKAADAAITLAPSALTGSVTLVASAAFFTSAMVGLRIRYLKRELLITAYTDSTHVTATVQETLPGTFSLTVASSAGFTVGEAVLGDSTGAKGFISAIPDATHVTVYLQATQIAFTTADKLVGPNSVTTISAVATTTPAAVPTWDISLFNAVFGYPSCCVLHRNRLLFGGHPAIPSALIGSRLNNFYSYDVGDQSDGDAIFETIGDAGASEIVQLHSAEQLLVMTDNGPYYVPENASNPFTPKNMAFYPFGSNWPITDTVEPRAFDNGVLIISGSLVIKARPTGNLTQVWDADEVSLLSSDIVDNPTRLFVTSNFGDGAERYAMMTNADGTMAILQLVEVQKIRNMTPWATTGLYVSGCAIQEHVYMTTQRTVNGSTRYYLELFDQDITLDCASQYADLAALNNVGTGVTSRYGTTPVNIVVDNKYHLGTYPLSIGNPPAGPYVVGLFYDSEIETMVPIIQDQEGAHQGELMRICHSYIKVKDSARFKANGTTLAAYQVTDNLSLPPPKRNEPIKFDFLGWKKEPTVIINQPDPLPLEVQSIKNVVAY